MRRDSIQRRLIVSVILAQLLLAAGLVFAGVFYTQRRLLTALDSGIQSRAMSVAALVRYTEDASGNVYFDGSLMPQPLDPAHPDLFAVWTERSGLLTHSANWPPALIISPTENRERWNFAWNGVPYRALRAVRVPVLDREEGSAFRPQTLTIIYAASRIEMNRQVRQAGVFIALASLLLLGMTVLLALWGIGRGLRPLQKLAAQAATVSAQRWDFHVPEDAQRIEELRPLTESMTQMLARLQDSFTRQKEFVANAAHELKTPVAVLKSTLQSVLQRPREADEYRNGLERALEDLNRLENLLQGMLRLARAEQYDGLGRELQPVDLAASCQEAISRARLLAEAKGVRIQLLAHGAATLKADAEDLQVVWANLLDNAVRYSPANQLVEVSLSHNGGRSAQISITDHGPGIAAADLPHIFDRFYRGDPSRTRATGGFGLGLAICKSLVEAYGGTIRAANASKQGTVITVEFPADEA
jgi:heavy metal sensor kinase